MLPTPPRRVAARIETERLVARAWRPTDAAAASAAIEASLPALRQWLPWAAREPLGLPERAAALRQFRARFDLGEAFHYGLFDPAERRVLGGAGLRPFEDGAAAELGYWIASGEAGRGLATVAAAALVQAAFVLLGVGRLELHADVANRASLRVAEKLGFVREGVLRRRLPFGADDPRDLAIYSLLAEEYPATLAAAAAIAAWDDLGERLL